ncbi:MAG TPA: glycogen debranching N-terminal domain-containing protein [Microthrixaceae bacterium]|nr:glycogen debranching N-terminal domain-containing protein [Microthrixaceae bacterium]
MTEAWAFQGPTASTSGPSVTLVEETSFCLSAPNGDIVPGHVHGLFFLDTRFLSGLELELDGHQTESLAVSDESPFEATFLVRPVGMTGHDSTLTAFRHRKIGRGMLEQLTICNNSPHEALTRVELHVEVDFADLFEVKESIPPATGPRRVDTGLSGVEFAAIRNGLERRTAIVAHPSPMISEHDRLVWELALEPGGRAELCIEIRGGVGEDEIEPRFACGADEVMSEPTRRLADWRADVPRVDTADQRLTGALARTAEDLGALRIIDPEHPDDVIVAAGAPWFMTLFGRDAILTAYMALMVDPRIALGVLRTLARLQGKQVQPETEEEPGRILHEIRFHDHPSWNLSDGTVYFGSADATPLFVVLLGEMRRWGLADDVVEELLPAADRALEWMLKFGDRDGDGYIEYQRATEGGLVNQGWKDAWDAIRFADGTYAEGPIALCEVQGYAYAAYLARAYFAEEEGDLAAMREWIDRAAQLRSNFHRDFWLPEKGWFALGLDGNKRPIDSLTSNMGHCLWTGIVDPEVAPSVAGHLMSPEMYSGWGIRTMASSMAAYNPVSYHLGSVWPHDNAICVAGLVRYGFTDDAHRVINGMLDVAQHHDGRLPELLAGVARSELSVPAVYPTSCMPQAWSAASPLLFLRSLLRVDPWMRRRQLWVAPSLPGWVHHIHIDRVPLDGGRISITADATGVRVDGLQDDVELHTDPRAPQTQVFEED